MTDKLEQLLRDADASACPPPLPAEDLAGRVRRLARRRRRRNLHLAGTAGAAMLALAMGAIAWQWGPAPARRNSGQIAIATRPRNNDELSPAQARVQIRRLGDEASVRTAAVERIMAEQQRHDRIAQLRRQIAEAGATDPLMRRFDEAAQKLLITADRLEFEFNDPRAAIEVYKSVLKQYPQTPSAEVAQIRLTTLQTETGGPT
jgi:hypothetical protein